MTSKGVNYFFSNYSDVQTLNTQADDNNGSVALASTAISTTNTPFNGSCEITYHVSFHGITGFIQFTSSAVNSGNPLRQYINPITGNSSGAFENMLNTPSYVGTDYNLSYGFFDAGTGTATGLTNRDQLYAYQTPAQKNWMGSLAQQNDVVNDAPFEKFVLPGAHDAGTFDLGPVNGLLSDIVCRAKLEAVLALIFPTLALAGAATPLLRRLIVGEAVTQKDTIPTMLDLGCRYFDFRPGHAPTGLKSCLPDIYHMHTLIPGQTYKNFLQAVMSWLVANDTEIVVIDLSTSGFYDHETMDPTVDELQMIFIEAQQAVGNGAESIQIGSNADLKTPYKDLISQNKRLFFLNQANLGYFQSTVYDSYTDAYATTNPQNIINALAAMNSTGQTKDLTVLQLQGTATAQNTAAVAASCFSSLSDAYCPLMSTKPNFDSHTYPWLCQNVLTNLRNDNLLVLLNDFVDSALTYHVAAPLTLSRCQSS